jgi:transcriptional regulator with XRE-family HTH domain
LSDFVFFARHFVVVQNRQMTALATTLKQLRKSHGWSQSRLATAAGLSRATVAAIELGRFQASDSRTLKALAQALKVPLSQLLEERPRVSVRSAKRPPVLDEFLATAWPKALRFTLDELAWLDLLPLSFWRDMAPTPQMVAELIAWHRRNRQHR